jgi:plasmid stabilization system protein ParE
MSRLIWTIPALEDLERLNQFLAEMSPTAASRAIKTIQQAILALENNPEIGRPVEELLLGYRELVIGFGQSAYVALYHYDGNQALILAVRHGREAGY